MKFKNYMTESQEQELVVEAYDNAKKYLADLKLKDKAVKEFMKNPESFITKYVTVIKTLEKIDIIDIYDKCLLGDCFVYFDCTADFIRKDDKAMKNSKITIRYDVDRKEFDRL